MIGKLKGIVDSIGADAAIIDVGGVGYEVALSARTLSLLPKPGEMVTLAIETHVREDAIRLFGFLSEAERSWFRLLQSVQGVGSKVALSILSTLDVATLSNAIVLQDRAMVARAPGVGPKVALRLVNELKDKVPASILVTQAQPGVANGAGADKTQPGAITAPFAEAISALMNLGYGPQEANAAVSAAASKAGETAKTEELIRLGLKEIGTRS